MLARGEEGSTPAVGEGTGHSPRKLGEHGERLASAQPFLTKPQIITTANQRTAPKQPHLHAEGGNSDEYGACNLTIPKRDNFGGLQGCAPMVVCFGGLFFWCGSVAFLVAGAQPLIRGRPSSGTDPASCKKNVGLQPYLILRRPRIMRSLRDALRGASCIAVCLFHWANCHCRVDSSAASALLIAFDSAQHDELPELVA